jgi:hypothetical protein
VPPKKESAAARKAAADKPDPKPSAGNEVYKNNKKLIDELLHRCCSHLNGQSTVIAEEVLARLPAYCEAHRVTLTERRRAKRGKKKPKRTSASDGWSVTGGQ